MVAPGFVTDESFHVTWRAAVIASCSDVNAQVPVSPVVHDADDASSLQTPVTIAPATTTSLSSVTVTETVADQPPDAADGSARASRLATPITGPVAAPFVDGVDVPGVRASSLHPDGGAASSHAPSFSDRDSAPNSATASAATIASAATRSLRDTVSMVPVLGCRDKDPHAWWWPQRVTCTMHGLSPARLQVTVAVDDAAIVAPTLSIESSVHVTSSDGFGVE